MIITKKHYRKFNFFISYCRMLFFILWEYLYDRLLFKKEIVQGVRGIPLSEQAIDCHNCSLCIDLCPEKALSRIDTELTLDLMKCTLCEYCITVCPDNYLTVTDFPHLVITEKNRFRAVVLKE